MARSMTVTGPTLTNPRWAGDYLGRDQLIPGGAKVVASAFNAVDAVVVTVGANAAQGATSVTVAALSGPIPNGTVLDLGTNKFARLTAAAAAGATSLTVSALPTALVTNDTATYPGVGRKTIAAGTAVGRTITERNAGTGYGPADASDDEVYLTAFEVYDVVQNNDVELVRPNTVIKENFLPNVANIVSGVMTKLRAAYVCVRGV